jgi:rifampicin phosphotransferase
MPLTYTCTFKQLRQNDILRVGGKGANLGEMTTAGLPVPPGFVVTTDAYDAFVNKHGLQKQIVQTAENARAGDRPSIEGAADAIQQLFLDAEIPADVAEALRAAYAALRAGAVAVRSSATAEDLTSASFAGQQDTYLNVRTPDALLEAVKKCWASLWTARAMAYRTRQGVEHVGVAMGVVVQTMVPAEVSGILFTANPITGARDELVVNASFGLGAAIVSGEVSPDTYVVDRESLAPKETRLGTKEVMIVADDQGLEGKGTIKQPVPAAQQSAAALDERLLGELAALALRVEALFGVPQDIEWAVADGSIWLVQARPITNLPPAPLHNVRWDPPIPGTVWMRRQVVEHMPEPLSPLFAELYLQEGLARSIESFAKSLYEMQSSMTDVTDIPKMLAEFLPGPFAVTVNGYAYSIASFSFHWRHVPLILRVYVGVLPALLRRGVAYWRDKAVPAYRQKIAYWKELDLAAAADEELLLGVRELAIADAEYWFAAAVPLGLSRATDSVLDSFLKSVAAGRNSSGIPGTLPTSGSYLRGFSSRAVEAQSTLEAIAEQIRGSATLCEQVIAAPAAHLVDILAEDPQGRRVADAIQRYLDRYGHQIYNLDFAVPTQAEDPLPVLLSLAAAVRNPGRDARAQQRKLAQEREVLVKSTEQALNPVQRRIFRLLLGWAQRSAPYREEAIFYVGAAWPALRRLALELGRRLTDAGSLGEPEDVFYLNSVELKAAIEARAIRSGHPELARLAQERRELREARKRLDPPLSVPPNATLQFGPIRFAMFEPQAGGASEGPTLHGFAVSPGRVTANASVICSPQDFEKMVPDTILVCPTTTPAWTPLFSQAAGLVTDIGGALAHGSIVAREFGIPAVMGTGVATQRIRSSQQVQVDGDAGTVTLVDEVNEAVETPPLAASTSSKKSMVMLFTLAAGAVALIFWWKKRQRSSNR